jgi:hypothetical protein
MLAVQVQRAWTVISELSQLWTAYSHVAPRRRPNNGGPVAMLDWEANGGDLANLTAVVDAFNTAGVTVQ